MIENAVNEKKSGMISIFRTRKAKIVLLLVVVSICGYMLEQYIVSGERSNITLEKSSGVKVNYISKIPQSSKVANLVPLTEAQVFQEQDTSIIKGVVEEIRNIKVVIDGEADYRSVITVRVQKVFRGDEKINSEITILCPTTINGEYEAEDTEIVSKLKLKSIGIFMPEKYGLDSIEEGAKGGKLYLSEVAQYGFMDGMRFGFIESKDGILYEERTFTSLKKNPSFTDIEKYIGTQLKRT